MTASLQGNITLHTKSIQDAIDKLNQLNGALKQSTTSAKAYERAEAKKVKSQQQSTNAQKNQTDILQRNQNLVERAANSLANYTQRIKRTVRDESKRNALLQQASQALRTYSSAVDKAEGDTTALQTAKTKLSSATGGLARAIREENKARQSGGKNVVATERALGQLNAQYQRATQAVKNANLTTQGQQAALTRLEIQYKEAAGALRQYGANTLQAVQAQNQFRNTVVQSSNTLRDSFKGVGRGAGQAGIQVQQFVGQIQGGVNPMVALSQQSADLGFALGMPLIGAVAGLAFSFGSFLSPEMFETKSAAQQLEEVMTSLDSTLTESSTGAFELAEEIQKIAERSERAARARLSTAMLDVQEGLEKAAESAINLTSLLDAGFGLSGVDDYAEALLKTGGLTQQQIQQSEGFRQAAKELGEELGVTGETAQQAGADMINLLSRINKEPTPKLFLELEEQLASFVDSGNAAESVKELYNELTTIFNSAATLGEKQARLNELVEDFDGKLSDLNETTKQSNEVQEFLRGIGEQAATVNMTARQLDVYRAKQMGLSESVVETINNMYDHIEAQEEQNEKSQESVRQLRQLSTIMDTVSSMRRTATTYTQAQSESELEAALASERNQQAINKQVSELQALFPENQKILAQRMGLSTAGKSQAEIEEALTRAYRSQAQAANEAQRGAQALFDFRQSSNKIQGEQTGIAGIEADFGNQEEQQRQAFGRLLQTNNLTDAQRQEYIAQYVANMKSLEQQKNAALAEAMQTGEQTANMNPLTDTERLRQDYEERKNVLKELFAGEQQLLQQHLAELDKSYKNQAWIQSLQQSADVTTNIMEGAMGVMSALGKEQTRESKALALTIAGIQQGVAIAKIWGDYASQPWVAAGMTAAAVGQFAQVVSQIRSQSYATGGFVSGAGTGTSDSIPARLSDGEYVINAASTRMLGKDTLDMINSTGRIPAYAVGGEVGRVPSIQPSMHNSWGNMSVQVINEGTGELEATRTEQGYGENGEMQMRVFVRQIVKEEMDMGQMDKSMARNYGINRQPTRR